MAFEGRPKRRSHLWFDLKWALLLLVAGIICAIFLESRYGSVIIPAVVLTYVVGWIYDGIQLARNDKQASGKFKFPDKDNK